MLVADGAPGAWGIVCTLIPLTKLSVDVKQLLADRSDEELTVIMSSIMNHVRS